MGPILPSWFRGHGLDSPDGRHLWGSGFDGHGAIRWVCRADGLTRAASMSDTVRRLLGDPWWHPRWAGPRHILLFDGQGPFALDPLEGTVRPLLEDPTGFDPWWWAQSNDATELLFVDRDGTVRHARLR